MFTTAGRNELYGDAFNDAVIIGPGKRFTDGLSTFDSTVVDGGVDGHRRLPSAELSGRLPAGPERLRPLLRALLLAGAALVLLALVVVNLG